MILLFVMGCAKDCSKEDLCQNVTYIGGVPLAQNITNESWIIPTNSSWITTETYNCTLYYCFINNSYYGDSCFPYTNDIKENVIDYENTNYENTTDYQICRIINKTKQYCYNETKT